MEREKQIFTNLKPTESEVFAGVTKEIILMPDQSLPDSEKVALSHELTPITGLGFMRDLSTEAGYQRLFEDVYNHVVPCDRLSVFRNPEGRVLAFIAAGIKEHQGISVYHLGGIIVDPNLHHKDFSIAILQKELTTTDSEILAFHTQSVLMERLGKKVSVFDAELSHQVAALIGTGNLHDTPTGPIDKERYGGQSLYEDVARFDSIAIKRTGFNYLKGDAVVFAGRIVR